MNRKNIDNVRFVDLDECVVLQIIPFEYADETRTLKNGYAVHGVTKNGLSIENLFVDKNSGTTKACERYIIDNWVSKSK